MSLILLVNTLSVGGIVLIHVAVIVILDDRLMCKISMHAFFSTTGHA